MRCGKVNEVEAKEPRQLSAKQLLAGASPAYLLKRCRGIWGFGFPRRAHNPEYVGSNPTSAILVWMGLGTVWWCAVSFGKVWLF